MGLPLKNNNNQEGCNPVSSTCVNQMFKVYSLEDPTTDQVRYIGYTGQSLEERLKEHLTIDCRFYKGNWIKSLGSKGIIPKISLVEDGFSLNQAKLMERHYIKLFKSFGARLTNLTDGGDGTPGLKLSEETRKRMSDRMVGEKSHWYGKKHSEESLAKMRSGVHKGENNGFYGRKHSEETKMIIKEKSKNQEVRVGWKHSDEAKKKVGDKNRGRIKTSSEIEKIRFKLKGRVFSEKHKQKLKEAWQRIKQKRQEELCCP